MSARFLLVHLDCEHFLAEVLEDRLQALGARGVETVDKTELEIAVKRPDSLDYASESLLESLPPRARIRAWFALEGPGEGSVLLRKDFSTLSEIYESDPQQAYALEDFKRLLEELCAELRENCADSSVCSCNGCEFVQEEDWEDCWKDFYDTLPVSPRIVINPSWIPYRKKSGEIVLELDPGSAFGTGYHESTALCLGFLDEMAATNASRFREAKILDLGTGSGILALAAAELGASDLEAIDIDPKAAEVAKENLTRSGWPDIPVRACQLGDTDGPFDLILANLVAKLHVAMADAYREKLKPGGRILVSGIIDDRAEEVREALLASGLKLQEQRMKHEWWAMLWEKPAAENEENEV